MRGVNNKYGLERKRRKKKKKKKYLIKWDEKKKILDGGKIEKMECFSEEKKTFKLVFYLF